MRAAAFFMLLAAGAGLSGCAAGEGRDYQAYLDGREIGRPTVQSFRHCQDYGCRVKYEVGLSAGEIRPVKKIFTPPPKTPEKERAAIARAIGAFERIVGKKTKTAQDQAGTFRKTGPGQLDCVDESTNTTVYLLLLKEKGWLKFHEVAAPASRVPIINAGRWPHQTAVIRETATGGLFAADSWFHDNGADAEIVPLERWKDGWKPENIGDSPL